jgi:uncharacterized protein YdaT
MPWTAAEFKARHFKKATAAQASKAAEMATAMVKGGTDEGVAIATAIKRSKGASPRVSIKKALRR